MSLTINSEGDEVFPCTPGLTLKKSLAKLDKLRRKIINNAILCKFLPYAIKKNITDKIEQLNFTTCIYRFCLNIVNNSYPLGHHNVSCVRLRKC